MEQDPSLGVTTGSAGPTEASCARPRAVVLLAEDDPALRSFFTAVLRDAGYRVLAAIDGQMALEAGERMELDLLLSDLEMPRLDGAGLARRLLARRPGLKVLIVSAGDAEAVPEFPFEPKPVSAARLLERVREVVGR